MPATLSAPILSREACIQAVHDGRFKRPLIFTNGVFDLLHRGHVSYLAEAATLGASLIVALNTDDSVRRLGKGPQRPINPLEDRQAVVAGLASVTAVTSFHEDTPLSLIMALKPDMIVKGGDYDMSTLPETAAIQQWGGRALAIPVRYPRSTTALADRLASGR